MGLFDFFRRKKPADPLQQAFQEADQGPSIHYVFAHIGLRQLALSEPLQYLSILASPDAERLITFVLDDVCKHLQKPRAFTPQAVKVHPVRVADYPCAIVEMPKPSRTAEAYFTALVVLLDTAEDFPDDPAAIPARYFTLEKGFSLDGADRTVLAEWDETAHSNYGDGPPPTVAGFAQALAGLLKQQR